MTSIWFVISNGSEIAVYDEWDDVFLFGISTVPGMKLWTCETREQAQKIADEQARSVDDDSGSTTIEMRDQPTPPDDEEPIVVPHKRGRFDEFAFDPAETLVPVTFSPPQEAAESSVKEVVEESKVSLLSADQRRVLDMVLSGDSVFFTGAAGTGKSFLINCIIEELQKRKKVVAVTASTGAAAVNIGGVTIHSMSGIGLGKEAASVLGPRSLNFKKARENIQKCNTLIIDEISMISGETFDKLEYVFRYVRCKGLGVMKAAPWGGVQLILSGDFLQLPPVQKMGEKDVQFAFESAAWRTSIKRMCVLRNQHRQSDETFIRALEELRHGVLSGSTRDLLQSRVRAVVDSPVLLFSRTVDVDRENERGLRELGDAMQQEFTSKDFYHSSLSKEQIERIKGFWPIEEKIVLKVGARVMLLRNIAVKVGLCNGAQGEITAFSFNSVMNCMLPRVKFRNGIEMTMFPEKWESKEDQLVLASRMQIPLVLAYALTIHKSQGCTLDNAQCNISDTFAGGQAYVAVSRTRSLAGLSISGVPSSFRVNERAVQFHRSFGD
jgi:ATP-dependent DNA helicase PIF1